MVAHDPEARPTAAEVAEQCRFLADVAVGPDLVAFAAESVVPWLEAVPEEPDPEVPIEHARILDQASEVPVLDPEVARALAEEEAEEAAWEESLVGWHALDDERAPDTTDVIVRASRRAARPGIAAPRPLADAEEPRSALGDEPPQRVASATAADPAEREPLDADTPLGPSLWERDRDDATAEAIDRARTARLAARAAATGAIPARLPSPGVDEEEEPTAWGLSPDAEPPRTDPPPARRPSARRRRASLATPIALIAAGLALLGLAGLALAAGWWWLG
jgi:hypothetical protein